MPLKRQLKSGSLKIVKNAFKISLSFDTFSDILDFLFNVCVLVLKNLILFCVY